MGQLQGGAGKRVDENLGESVRKDGGGMRSLGE